MGLLLSLRSHSCLTIWCKSSGNVFLISIIKMFNLSG
jgi:hypothetical protein